MSLEESMAKIWNKTKVAAAGVSLALLSTEEALAEQCWGNPNEYVPRLNESQFCIFLGVYLGILLLGTVGAAYLIHKEHKGDY
jgi:hypothetical protein